MGFELGDFPFFSSPVGIKSKSKLKMESLRITRKLAALYPPLKTTKSSLSYHSIRACKRLRKERSQDWLSFNPGLLKTAFVLNGFPLGAHSTNTDSSSATQSKTARESNTELKTITSNSTYHIAGFDFSVPLSWLRLTEDMKWSKQEAKKECSQCFIFSFDKAED